MPLFGRKKEVSDIQKVKEAIEMPPAFEKPSEAVEMLRRTIEMPARKNPKPVEKDVPVERHEERMPEIELPEPIAQMKIPEPALRVEEHKEKVSFAPLFVKLDKYKQILNALVELKTTIAAIKNSFSVLNELERLKMESLKMIQASVDKMDKRLVALDSEFLRPSGFHEEMPAEMYNSESIGGVINDLRSQIEQLRAEIQV